MELPDDVLQLVREYSRPILRYPAEYKRYVQMHRKEWFVLKKLLSGPIADRLVTVLVSYMNAASSAQEMVREVHKITPDTHPDFVSRCEEIDRISETMRVYMDQRDTYFVSLFTLIQEYNII